MSNKLYNKEYKSFEVQSAIKEESPIEVSPEVEEVKEDVKEIPEVRQEKNKKQEVVKPIVYKKQGKIIVITRDGCIVEILGQPGNNVRLFGKDFLAKKLGDIIEF